MISAFTGRVSCSPAQQTSEWRCRFQRHAPTLFDPCQDMHEEQVKDSFRGRQSNRIRACIQLISLLCCTPDQCACVDDCARNVILLATGTLQDHSFLMCSRPTGREREGLAACVTRDREVRLIVLYLSQHMKERLGGVEPPASLVHPTKGGTRADPRTSAAT